MIEIHNEKEKEKIHEVLQHAGLVFNEECEMLSVYENDKIIEFAYYSIDKDSINVKFISSMTNDFSLIDGIIKTLIFYCDLKSKDYLIIPSSYKRIKIAYGFYDSNDNCILSIKDYNDLHKGC